MFKWLQKLRLIVSRYDSDLRNAHVRIADLEKLVKDRTNIAVDVGFKSANHVIVIGKYRGADYIQTYEVGTRDVGELIDRLRDMSRYGSVKKVDAPPMFRAVFEREVINF